jgi:sterol desaturase/sphingolipid hydroxylase (fatty acid hydroxylase superfamily)
MLDSSSWLRLGAFAICLAALALLEKWRPERTAPSDRARIALDNLLLGAVSLALLRVALPLLTINTAQIAAAHHFGLFTRYDINYGLAAILSFFALDAAIYWQHRAMHASQWLWRLHAVHHTELHLDVTSGLRFHPFEILLSALWKLAVVTLLGVPAAAVLAFEIALGAGALIQHANWRIGPRLERILRWLLVTPRMHRRHHSVVLEDSQNNFGTIVPWWDVIFGTRAQDAAPADVSIGLPSSRQLYPLPLLELLKMPIYFSKYK